MLLLTEHNMERSIVLAAACRRVVEIRETEMIALAREIRSQIVEAWNKGQK